MNVGLFFGSFNPVHTGHIAIGEYFLKHNNLFEVWYILTPINPFKSKTSYYSIEVKDRVNMLKLILSNKKKMIFCDFEINLSPPFYTYNTLKKLKKKYPRNNFFFILGEDNYTSMDTWFRGQDIKQEEKLLIYPRYNSNQNDKIKKKKLLKKLVYLSSTNIREKLFKRKYNGVEKDLTKPIFEYILSNKLYQNKN